MRLCKSLGEIRNLPSHLRTTCPQPISNSPLPWNRGVSRSCRYEESQEGRSCESSYHGELSASMNSFRGSLKPFFFMDVAGEDVESASTQSRESIKTIYERPQQQTATTTVPVDLVKKDNPREMRSSIPIAIPPGQLTESFAKIGGKSNGNQMDVARSAPVPVPRRQNPATSNQESTDSIESEEFIPPHVFLMRRSLQDPTRSQIPNTSKGLSSLRIRNEVLEKKGYFDGYTELSQKPDIRRKMPAGQTEKSKIVRKHLALY